MLPGSYTLSELADILGAKLKGDADCKITGVAPLEKAQSGQISFLTHPQFRSFLATTAASAVIISPRDIEVCPHNALITENPYLGYAKVAQVFKPKMTIKTGIHPSAVIGQNCEIAADASIGANCVLGDRVRIGANSIIGPGSVIGDNTEIGSACQIAANVSISYDIKIGDRVIMHSGVVIGSDGFGMARDGKVWFKIPQLANVVIGNDVEIGANTTVDRGGLENTVIEDGVKLDNLIQVAHNVRIGAHTVIAACTAIGGSVQIGKYCMVGGAVTFSDHVTITDEVIVIGTATVEKSITERGAYGSGTGLQPFRDLKRNVVRYRHLDDLMKRLEKLEKAHEHDGH